MLTSLFNEFENCVLRLMLSPSFGEDLVESILLEAEFVSYEYSGSCYFLTVKHQNPPNGRIVFSEPCVVGRVGEIQSGFIVFVEGNELMFECHTWGAFDVPQNFRELDVLVKVLS